MPETIQKMKPLRRFIEGAEIIVRRDNDKKTLTFPASSEEKVERWYGMEVLSHEKKAVRLDRAKRGAMPLLFNHNIDDPIGVVDDARVEKGRLMVDAHLFDTERAKDVETMIEGGLRNVSIAYRSYVIEEDVKSETFTLTDWEPYEVSIVSVPADPTVGIGRNEAEFEVRMVRTSQPAVSAKGNTMGDQATATAADNAEKDKEKPPANINGGERSETALEMEQSRRRAIEYFARANKIADNIKDAWINQGYNMEQVGRDILQIQEDRTKNNPQPASRIGMSGKDVQQFSMVRAILACRDNDWKNAGFELECSRAVAQKLNKVAEPTKFYVPFDVLQRPMDASVVQRALAEIYGKRDLTVGVAGAGGFLVETENVGFIEMLRNRSVVFRMGARRLSGLQGSVTIPRQSAAATGSWLLTEATAITESQQTFVQLALSPKNIGAYTEISRQLLLQSSPGVEGIVTDDLARVVALAADLAGLEGSGAGGQPTGLANTAGIGNVAAGAASYAKVLEFQEDVATSNVMPMRGGYVTHPATASVLMQKQRFTSTDTPLWNGNLWDGVVSGFPAMSSNQLASGVIDFGDWQEMVIAEWGVLEVEVNPYANFQAGIIGVRAIYSLDVGIRRPFAFSRATGITA